MSSDSICLCGKKRKGLNLTNWNRHHSSCAVTKLKAKKICSDVTSFFRNHESMPQSKNPFKKGEY